MGVFDSLGKVLQTVVAPALAPVAGVVNAVSGSTVVKLDYGTKVGNFLGDLGTLSAAPINTSINSPLGRKYKLDYNTSEVKKISELSQKPQQFINVGAKSFADNLLGGLPTKLANSIRSKENQESVGHYSDADGLGSAAGVANSLGAMYASSVASGAEGSSAGSAQIAQTVGSGAPSGAVQGQLQIHLDNLSSSAASQKNDVAVASLGGVSPILLIIGVVVLYFMSKQKK